MEKNEMGMENGGIIIEWRKKRLSRECDPWWMNEGIDVAWSIQLWINELTEWANHHTNSVIHE